MAAGDGESRRIIGMFPFIDKLTLYIHDSLVKHKDIEAAAEFAKKHNIDLKQRLEIDVPEGYLYQWYTNYLETHPNPTSSIGDSPSRPKQQGANDIVAYIHFGNDASEEEELAFDVRNIGLLCPRVRRVTCCHFSSCGDFIASAGYDLIVMKIGADGREWNYTEPEHSDIITDVRFKPNSLQVATSSFDKTILLWDFSKSSKSLFKLVGHGAKVMSLDFNEKDPNLLCSCDADNEIRFWNLKYETPYCICTFQGGNKLVRFQPQSGNVLAAVSGRTINLIDVDTNQILNKFEGHTKDIQSICWHDSGNYIASVTEDRARLWCLSSGICIYELHSNDYILESCIFHPRHQDLVIIASRKLMIVWNTKESENSCSVSFPAYQGVISSLARNPNGVIAAATQDGVLMFYKFQNKDED